jgi:hypothetical protein
MSGCGVVTPLESTIPEYQHNDSSIHDTYPFEVGDKKFWLVWNWGQPDFADQGKWYYNTPKGQVQISFHISDIGDIISNIWLIP